tara:strand:- start:75 stop:902 length:828 start_codon:yes stop_codon:yes gene_type:complete
MSKKFFRYKAFERIFRQSEDSEEVVNRVENKIKYHNTDAYERNSATQLWWCSTDSEEEYKKNLEERPDMLKQYGWLDSNINYDLNQYGFREDEFKESPTSWVAAGECFTFGTGLTETMTWPTMLEYKTGKKVWNLGLPLAPLDVTFRVLYAWLPIIRPEKLLLLESSQLAREVWVDEKPEPIGFWLTDENDSWKKSLASDKVERYISRQKNLMAINELCVQLDIELHTISALERHELGVKAWESGEGEPYAVCRDLMHPGFHFQKAITERWLEGL